MVKYVDKNVWVEQVLMPDESTPILGGTPDWDEDNMLAGWSNVPAGQLADRTRFLKDKVEELEQEIETGGSNALQKDNNLSDLQDVGQAKFNLGLNLVDNTRDLDKPVSDLTQEALDEKVDKEAGKGLSSNDFTTAEKNKLSGIQAGAQVNVATNLGVGTRTTTSVPVTSSTGTTATLPAATTSLAGVMSSADKTKLGGIATGATANATDAQLRDRSTHTGEQAISTITGLQTALDGKAANSVSINAGSGLTGGGNLTTSRTLTLGTPSTITASTTNSVSSTSHTHEITLTKADIGLDNVDNTSDSAKPISTATQNALNNKVDKVSGYGLSQANFTSAEKTKLAGLESSKWKGQFVSEAALNTAFPTTEPGSYADVDSGVGQDVARYIWDSTDSKWVKQSGVVAPLTSAQVKQLYEANPDTNAFTNTEKSKLAGIANNANNYVHPNSGVSAGTYKSVTVNAQGHVTGGSNPSTLSGYGITDAAPLSHVGSTGNAHGVATPSVAGFMSAADKQKLDGISDGAGVPSVTSVAGKQGAVTLVKGDVGLGNVDNTADSVKNVASAAKLTTARTISATGDASWSVSFNGSGNSSAALTLTNSGVTAGTYTKVTVDAKGRATGGASLTEADIPALSTSKVTGLGTAATRNVGTSSGNVMEVGAFGLGVGTVNNLLPGAVDNALPGTFMGATGTTESDAVAAGFPALGGSSSAPRAWTLLTQGATARRTQIATEVFGVGTIRGRTFLRVRHDTTWYPWYEVFTSNSFIPSSKANVLSGTDGSYVSGGTYLNVISWNDMGSLSANTSINLDTSLNHRLTAAASLTLDATNVDPGKTGDIVINTPTAVTVSWTAKWKFLGSVPNIGGAGETWVVSYKVFDANTIYAAAVKVA